MTTTNDEELTIHSGDLIWKTIIEYYYENAFIRGYPYYQITRVNDMYYLWELKLEDPNAYDYRIIDQNEDFSPLNEKGMALGDVIGKKYYSLNLRDLRGQELIDRIKSDGFPYRPLK